MIYCNQDIYVLIIAAKKGINMQKTEAELIKVKSQIDITLAEKGKFKNRQDFAKKNGFAPTLLAKVIKGIVLGYPIKTSPKKQNLKILFCLSQETDIELFRKAFEELNARYQQREMRNVRKRKIQN